ncbi:MAG: hypothetical protein KGJ57_00180 [Sphingomonadales bacterium]|nr:hypothetical protein [Sphingomonadales bacterium]MDE2167824.1 hypothetical protein [Sphingomonadales bacterium]
MTEPFPWKSTLPLAVIAMIIAAFLPFDRGISLLTSGDLRLHMLLVGALAMGGGWLGQRAGLNLQGGVGVGLLFAPGGAAYVLLLDVVLFHRLLPQGTLALAHSPLVGRWIVFMGRAFYENVIYRLFVFSLMMFGLQRFHAKTKPQLPVVLLAGLMAQMINIGLNVWLTVDDAPSLAELGYWSVRYVAPGVLWAWIYWRYGFLTTEIASVGGHFFLQPAYGLLV